MGLPTYFKMNKTGIRLSKMHAVALMQLLSLQKM